MDCTLSARASTVLVQRCELQCAIGGTRVRPNNGLVLSLVVNRTSCARTNGSLAQHGQLLCNGRNLYRWREVAQQKLAALARVSSMVISDCLSDIPSFSMSNPTIRTVLHAGRAPEQDGQRVDWDIRIGKTMTTPAILKTCEHK